MYALNKHLHAFLQLNRGLIYFHVVVGNSDKAYAVTKTCWEKKKALDLIKYEN
jgi:hypothetical protein